MDDITRKLRRTGATASGLFRFWRLAIAEKMPILGDQLIDSPNLMVWGDQHVDDDPSGDVVADLTVFDRVDLAVGGEVADSLVLSRCCVRRGSVDVVVDTGLRTACRVFGPRGCRRGRDSAGQMATMEYRWS